MGNNEDFATLIATVPSMMRTMSRMNQELSEAERLDREDTTSSPVQKMANHIHRTSEIVAEYSSEIIGEVRRYKTGGHLGELSSDEKFFLRKIIMAMMTMIYFFLNDIIFPRPNQNPRQGNPVLALPNLVHAELTFLDSGDEEDSEN